MSGTQDYHVLEKIVADGDIPITFHVNRITGLRVVTSYVECPIINGDLVFATEAFDDDGLPHTLEHLVFLGSEDYPYKGVLDLLANRSLASGTNAMTDVDHTNYTLSTAGSDGFLNLLPIYLDHLLFPTLTEAGYRTEVHHINGQGEDAGVVYAEMQARENTGHSKCDLEMLRYLYPGKCGYSSETGGCLENLRNSTNITKVREYHKNFYHSNNLCIIVVGPIKPEAIFKAIKPIEDKIVSRRMHQAPIETPWSSPVQPLEKSIKRKIQYASDTDDDVIVHIGYRGPKVLENYQEFLAVQMLMEYLNGASISPIQRDFVESEEAYCSSVSHGMLENSTSCIYLTFESVGKKYMDLVDSKLDELLANIVSGQEKINMDRMQTVLTRTIVGRLSMAETSPHALVLGPVIGHFLYGRDGSIGHRACEIPLIEQMTKFDSNFWVKLLEKYFTGPDSRKVSVVGEASPSYMRTMAEVENKRIEDQKQALKHELDKMAQVLKSSIEANEQPAPQSMLISIPVPSVDSIKFHPIERVILDKSLTPFRIQYDSIRTNFVACSLYMDTSNILSRQDRLYLPLLTEILTEAPIERDGRIIPYESVVEGLLTDTITYGTTLGISSGSAHSVGIAGMLFGVVIQVEVKNYEKAVRWFKEILSKTLFTHERIKTVATRMVSDISQYRRSGGKVLSSVANGMIFQSNSNQWATNFLRQHKFLKNLIETLKQKPETIVEDLTRVRDTIARPCNIFVHLTLNKDNIDVSKIHEPWIDLLPSTSTNPTDSQLDLRKIIPCHELVQPSEEIKSSIVAVGSAESNYMIQVVKSINDPLHPELAALHVLISYLCQLEGPLWRRIRGLGLSYNYSINVSPAEGLLYFQLHKSSQLLEAHHEARLIVEKYLTGEEEFQDDLLESAKSSLIFEFIKREKSAVRKSMLSLIAHLRDIDVNYNRMLIERISRINKDDLRSVGPKYLHPLFKDPERLTVVCCHPSKQNELIKGFKPVCDLTKLSISDETFLNAVE